MPVADGGPEPDALTCLVGSTGCECTPGGGCEPGLACNEDHKCANVDAPAHCYMACDGDFLDPASQRLLRCPADKLMAGCFQDGRSCREGSCLRADDPVPSCQTDAECPEHQGCFDGLCLSDCASSRECAAAGEICDHRTHR